MISKVAVKNILGNLPFTAEIYWYLRQSGKPVNRGFSLKRLQEHLPEWRSQVATHLHRNGTPQSGKRVAVFSVLHYWISHATLLGLALAGQGHHVSLAYLPYGKWQKPINKFDLRRQNLYAHSVLEKASPYINIVSLLNEKQDLKPLPPALEQAVAEISYKDTQYTLQVEKVSLECELFRLRQERNQFVAGAALAWLQANLVDVMIIPNGSILEFGAVYQVLNYLRTVSVDIPVVTYEFGEQRQRVWLARNAEVMRQQTRDMWVARGNQGLTSGQLDQARNLFAARQNASLWENFARRWQGVASAGGEQVRNALGLDDRPVVLLATNVIGDSLTLGRQVFSQNMTDWLEHTVKFFAENKNAQLVIRIHPGELITKGPSVAEVITQVVSELPPHIHVVAADAPINTYDLVEVADLGLVYTTTVGLEMAMSGLPVIVAGDTHYRDKGFTFDPNSWQDYYLVLGRVIQNPQSHRITNQQVELAWEYAYRFFFEFPRPFPWHLVHMWDDIKRWPIQKVLNEEGQAVFGTTFRNLLGEPIEWASIT